MQIESPLTLFGSRNPSAIRIFRACKGLTIPLITGTGPSARCLCHGIGRRDLHSSCGRHLRRRVQSHVCAETAHPAGDRFHLREAPDATIGLATRSLSTTKPARSSQVAVATLGEGQACAGRNARQQRGSARADGQSWAGQAVIVWRYAFDMGGDVAAFAADSGSSLRVMGRRESARYKSLSFEFSAATAQGPTLQVIKRGPFRTGLNSRYGAYACGAGCSGSSSK